MCFALFLLCDVILRALLCLGVHRYRELRQRGEGIQKNGDGDGGEGGRRGEGEINRERQRII